MRTVSYIPSRDEMLLEFLPVRKKHARKIGRFRLWSDKDGNIRAIAIMSFTEELEEFKKNRNRVKLGGIWKGVKITEQDIKEARHDLLRKLEEKW